MKDNFRLWANSFIGTEKLLFRLEGNGDTALYKTQMRHGDFYDIAVYHVWIAGDWVFSTTNYIEGYNTYKEKLNER